MTKEVPLTFACTDEVLQPLDLGWKWFRVDIPYTSLEECWSQAMTVEVVKALGEVILDGLISRSSRGHGQFGRGCMLGGVVVRPHGM